MRIFYAVPRSAWVDLNLRRSLEDMGHTLVRFDFPGWPDDADPVWVQRGKPRTNERLLRTFRSALQSGPLDLFFGYFYSSVIYPDTIDLIRQSGVPTVNFSCNNVHQFDLVRDIANRFDVCMVPELAALEDFRAVGARPVRIQLAANPNIYRPYPEPRRYDATFVGQRYADRTEYLQHLYMHGVGVRAWGAGWQPRKGLDVAHAKAAWALVEDERMDGVRRLVRQRLARYRTQSVLAPGSPNVAERVTAMPDTAAQRIDTSAYGGPRLLQRDLIKMYSESRISLGFATAGDSHLRATRLRHLRLREFEAPMSGALYMTEDQPELREYFTPGREVLTYTDRDDLLDKVRYYLAHAELSERIRWHAWERARREHTWQHRFQDLFSVLGLRAGAHAA
ncbi:MAG: hypothetical protein NVSMB2_19930 [Chloroflexota bacterium]